MRYAFDYIPLEGGIGLEIQDTWSPSDAVFTLIMKPDDFSELAAKTIAYQNSIGADKKPKPGTIPIDFDKAG